MNCKLFILAGGFICAVLIFLFYSCVGDDPFGEQQELPTEITFGRNRELTIAVAKSWYAANQTPVTRMATTPENAFGFLITPSWNHAKEWKKGRYEVVESSLRSNVDVLFYDRDTHSQKGRLSKAKKSKVKNVGRSVILKDVLTGEIILFNMVFIGSHEYLMQEQNRLSDNTYLYRKPDFDGKVLYFNSNGEFVNGWKYEKGKITKQLSPAPDIDEALPDIATDATTRGIECYTTYDYYSYYDCPSTRAYWDDWMDFYGGSEFGSGSDGGGGNSGGNNDWWDGDPNITHPLDEVGITAPACSWVTVTIPYQECVWVEDSDGEYGEGGGYGGGGNTPPLTSEPTKKLVQKLENAVLEMLDYDIAKIIYDYLTSNDFRFSDVRINSNLSSTAGLTYPLLQLQFLDTDCIDDEAIFHESVHLFQHHTMSESYTSSLNGLMEFERILFEDILYTVRYSNQYGIINNYGDKAFAWGYNGFLDDMETDYQNWIKTITSFGSEFPDSFSMDELRSWAIKFGQNTSNSSYRSYDYTLPYSFAPLKK